MSCSMYKHDKRKMDNSKLVGLIGHYSESDAHNDCIYTDNLQISPVIGSHSIINYTVNDKGAIFMLQINALCKIYFCIYVIIIKFKN